MTTIIASYTEQKYLDFPVFAFDAPTFKEGVDEFRKAESNRDENQDFEFRGHKFDQDDVDFQFCTADEYIESLKLKLLVRGSEGQILQPHQL